MAAAEFFELPEDIYHRIQSLLSSKEAARTTILSKSWCSAWLTRPIIDFDLRDFHHRSGSFSELSEKTIRRYEISNLMIESFTLRNIEKYWSNNYSPIPNLIVSALKLGATSLSIGVRSWNFASQYLSVLPGKVSEIDIGWSRLRSLSLECVSIRCRDEFVGIISSCTSLEELSLHRMHDFGVGDGDDGIVLFLRRLRSLVLDHVDFRALFLDDLAFKFPSLEDLTLCMWMREAQEEMLISSPSLERVDFSVSRYDYGVSNECGLRVRFEVPSICKLTFKGSIFPLLSLGSDSIGWESDHGSGMHHRHHPKCLTANNIGFLGEEFLRGLDVRIENLGELMYGLNDLKEARAQVFDEADSMWRDVELSADSTIPEHNRDFRFQLIWLQNQKKLN